MRGNTGPHVEVFMNDASTVETAIAGRSEIYTRSDR